VNVTIDSLSVEVEGAEAQRHRVVPITRRALALLSELVATRLATVGVDLDPSRGADVHAASVAINLQLMGDEEIARQLARSLYAAIETHLGVGSGR
jgi:hypothetical protein